MTTHHMKSTANLTQLTAGLLACVRIFMPVSVLAISYDSPWPFVYRT